jgi:hypothetical protein
MAGRSRARLKAPGARPTVKAGWFTRNHENPAHSGTPAAGRGPAGKTSQPAKQRDHQT